MGEQRHRQDYRMVRLPLDIYNQVLAKVQGGQFESVEEYVAFVLSEVLGDEHPLDEAKEKIIEDRLRGLGYV